MFVQCPFNHLQVRDSISDSYHENSNLYSCSYSEVATIYTNHTSHIKGPYANHILIPRAQPEVVYFLISNESPYFSSCKSKISALNSL